MSRLNVFLASCAAILLAPLASVSRAELRVYEGFEYSAGDLLHGKTGGTGFANAWTDFQFTGDAAADTGRAAVISGASLQYNLLATSGGSVLEQSSTDPLEPSNSFLTRRFGTAIAPADAQTLTEFWIGFLVRYTAPGSNQTDIPEDGFLLQLYTGTTPGVSTDTSLSLGDSANPAHNDLYRISSSSGSTTQSNSSTITPQLGRTDLLVAKITFNASGTSDTVRLFVNPTPGVMPLDAVANATLTPTFNLPGFNSMRFFSGDNVAQWGVDELRIGTTYGDVAPVVPEVSSAFWLHAGAALLLRRNRRFARG